MRGAYPYLKLHWYPHLSPIEAEIWDRFIGEFPTVYDSCDYDVKLGSIPDFVLEHPDAEMRAQAPLYQYKIDVIGYKDDQSDIIELKHAATMRALGQVKGYRDLHMRDFPAPVIPKCVVITDVLMPDMAHLAFAAGVQLVVV